MNNLEKPIRVAFYIRVSTEEQVKQGYGIEMQLEALKDLVSHKRKYNNWVHKPEWVFVDNACSGADLNRLGFKNMMEAVKRKEFDIIAVWKIDRLSRNLSHLLKCFEDFQKHQVSFYSLKENVDFSGAIGKLTFQIFGALAEFERETIKARTIEGKIASARMGNYIGNGIPYGYKKVPNKQTQKGSILEIVQKEAKIVKQIFNWFVFERANYEEITRRLNEQNIPKGVASRVKDKKTKWHAPSVRRIIHNTAYSGLRVETIKDSDGKEQNIKVKVPRIISELLFLQAQSIARETSDTKGKKGGGKNKYLLSRKIIDLETGRKFVGYSRTKGGAGYRRKSFYDNTTDIKYPNKEIPAEALEKFVWEHIKIAVEQPKKFYSLYKQQTSSKKTIEHLKDNQAQLEGNIERNQNKIEKIDDDFYEGNISEEQREKRRNVCRAVIKVTEKRLLELNKELDALIQASIAKDAITNYSKNFSEKLDNLTFEQRCILVDMLVENINVFEEKDKIRVIINFKFAHHKETQTQSVVEPEKSLINTKETRIVSFSNFNGRGGEPQSEPLTTRCEPFIEEALYEVRAYFNQPNCTGFDQFYKMISKIEIS